MAKTLIISMMDRGNVGIIRSPVRASILPDRAPTHGQSGGVANSLDKAKARSGWRGTRARCPYIRKMRHSASCVMAGGGGVANEPAALPCITAQEEAGGHAD
jgi:hypothetical protein